MKSRRRNYEGCISFILHLVLILCPSVVMGQMHRYNPNFAISHRNFCDTIPIEVEDDQIYINVTMNGKSYRFNLDTGSSQGMVFTGSRIDSLKELGNIISRDANNQTDTVRVVQIPKFTLGSLSIDGYVASLLPSSAVRQKFDAIIGFDLFNYKIVFLNAGRVRLRQMSGASLCSVAARAQVDSVLVVYIHIRLGHSDGIPGDFVDVLLRGADHIRVYGMIGVVVDIDALINRMNVEYVVSADLLSRNGECRHIRGAALDDKAVVHLYAVLVNLYLEQVAGVDFACIGGNREVAVLNDVVCCFESVVGRFPSVVRVDRLVDHLTVV